MICARQRLFQAVCNATEFPFQFGERSGRVRKDVPARQLLERPYYQEGKVDRQLASQSVQPLPERS